MVRPHDPRKPHDPRRSLRGGRSSFRAPALLLAVVSVLALGAGVTLVVHRRPPSSPTSANGDGAAATRTSEHDAQGDDVAPLSDECWLASRHIEEAREHAWVRAHLELRTTVRASKAPAGAPIEWHVAVPEHLRTLFPAVSRDGRTVVARYRESASQEIVDDVERMSFFSVTTGKPIATFVLDMARELDLGTKASPAALREARERDRVAANRLLDATEWRRLPTSRMADDICPGAFEELDRARRPELAGRRTVRGRGRRSRVRPRPEATRRAVGRGRRASLDRHPSRRPRLRRALR